MALDRDLGALLDKHGCVMIRQTNHFIFRHPCGALITVPKSPRDVVVSVKRTRSILKQIERRAAQA